MSKATFEDIKHHGADGTEFWLARELQEALEYSQWRNFEAVIEKAKEACRNSNNEETYHFAEVSKMVNVGSGADREVVDYRLSRYACYLIVQNGDPQKQVIAMGQTYFAIKTRQQELAEKHEQLTEEQKRVAIRGELTLHNKSLAEAASAAGVETPKDYAEFQNKGYHGLYGGLGMKEIHAKKELKKSQKMLDHMGSVELAANLFRATQTDEKLRREDIKGRAKANETHYQVGKKVRQTIKELGGTMPENLFTPEKSILSLEKEQDIKNFKGGKQNEQTYGDVEEIVGARREQNGVARYGRARGTAGRAGQNGA